MPGAGRHADGWVVLMGLAILFGLLGLVATVIGALSMFMAFMPKFGGGDERWAFPFGLAVFAAGLGLIFWAGSLA